MNIVVTNDDGYQAQGLKVLTNILSSYGNITVIAPKFPQSGMSMAVTMGYKPIAVKHIGQIDNQDWWYLDGTPASCVKFAEDNIFNGQKIDLVVSGINHGSNAGTAAVYSGTLGAAMEGAVNGVYSIGISLDTFSHEADFSTIEELLPPILDKLLSLKDHKYGDFININFPNLSSKQIKGIKVCTMGKVHWEKEYQNYHEYMSSKAKAIPEEAQKYIDNAEDGEKIYVMAGDMVDNGIEAQDADHRRLSEGYITITPHNFDNTDLNELDRLSKVF